MATITRDLRILWRDQPISEQANELLDTTHPQYPEWVCRQVDVEGVQLGLQRAWLRLRAVYQFEPLPQPDVVVEA